MRDDLAQRVAASARSRRRYPERSRARNKVARALKSGRLTRPGRCQGCGVECRPEASHDDYARPLDVEWLCRLCHARKDRSSQCPNGHPYAPETTGRTSRGHRMCLLCRREVKRRNRAKTRTR